MAKNRINRDNKWRRSRRKKKREKEHRYLRMFCARKFAKKKVIDDVVSSYFLVRFSFFYVYFWIVDDSLLRSDQYWRFQDTTCPMRIADDTREIENKFAIKNGTPWKGKYRYLIVWNEENSICDRNHNNKDQLWWLDHRSSLVFDQLELSR